MTLKENINHAQNGLRNNKECDIEKDGIKYHFDSKSQACKYASENLGASKSTLQKYGKSNGCVIIESVTTSGQPRRAGYLLPPEAQGHLNPSYWTW